MKMLTPFNTKETFISVTRKRDSDGNVAPEANPGAVEVEIIKYDDFFSVVLTDMGLKKYVEIPEEA